VVERVAEWQLSHPAKHPVTSWIQAPFYAGLMALSQTTGDPHWREAAYAIGEKAEWKLGAKPGHTHYHADYHAVGQMYAEMYALKKEPKLIADMRAKFDDILANPKDDNLLFDRVQNPDYLDRWSWCDSLFMAPPAWARLSAVTGDDRYLEFAVQKWRLASDYLYDKAEHLYFRDSTYFDKREANGRKVFWSRGNGWVMAGFVRFLQYLPADHPQRPWFVAQFKEMADKLITCQQPDGLWRSSLLDPASFPLKEVSGSAFYTYAFAWGINEGLLDADKFMPAVEKAWAALKLCVDADGKLTHVQPVGADPRKFPADSTEVYGVGGFILAGTEIAKLGTQPAAARGAQQQYEPSPSRH
jgi:rhamnogalacturonyl hydrolase YesR